LVWSSTNWNGAVPSAGASSDVGVGKGETWLGASADGVGCTAGVGKGETWLGASADGVGCTPDAGKGETWLGTMAGGVGSGVAVPQPAITRLRTNNTMIVGHLKHAPPDGRGITDDPKTWNLTRI
jgi:hypothetical protein